MVEPRSFLSLSKAAKETGKSKSVISNAIKSGRMSANKNDLGHYSIDPVELFRVFPQNDKNPSKNDEKERNSTAEKNGQNPLKIKELELELKYKDKEINQLANLLAKSEQSEKDWKEQATTLLLTHQPQKKSFPWGRAVAACLIIASLAIGGTIAVLSPEKLAFLNTNEPQAVAAMRTDEALRQIEPAAGSPEKGAQTFLELGSKDANQKE